MFEKMGAGLVLLMLSSATALAGDAEPAALTPAPKFVDGGWKSIHKFITVRLDADGLGQRTFEFEYRAATRAGVAAIANETFDYDPNFEVLSLEGLETVKADGTVVPVDPRAIHDQSVRADERAPYIDDLREKIVAYPDVEPGDAIRGKAVTRTIKSLLGGEYANSWSQRADLSDEELSVVVDAPEELPLRTAVNGLVETVRNENGRVIHSVEFPRSPPHVLTDALSSGDVAPRFDVSTFASYGQFAKTIADLNGSNGVADAAIKTEVARIVDGAADAREKAKRLSDWVEEHIRYVGIGLGNGGFVSEPAATTFAARFGDCKAHATLLKAMLAEVGIEAHLTLVDAGTGYTLPALPIDIFDHEIVYVPAFDVYLDPTDPFGVFGAPLMELGGKPALDLATGETRTIPLATPDDMKLGVETHTKMSPEGIRSGDSVLTGERNGESYRRYETTTFCDCNDPRRTLEAVMASHDYRGSGDYAFPDAHELSQPFVIKAHFAEDKPWDIHRFGAAIWVDTPVDPSWSLSWMIHRGVVGRAAACFPIDFMENNVFELPAGIEALEIEDPLAIYDSVSGRTALGEVAARISIRASFAVHGREITLSNQVRIGFSAPLCSGEALDHVDRALGRWENYRYTLVPLSTGAWYQPQNWLKTMAEAKSQKN